MSVTIQSWKKLFLFCLGLFIASAFCMKWMEDDFWSNGKKFTIIGLELLYDRYKMTAVFAAMDPPVKQVLFYHLSFDFIFMAGVYPGIASLCMIARDKANAITLKKILFIMAAAQWLAWAADIIENIYLLRWLDHPQVGSQQLTLFHLIVGLKWSAALLGVLFSLFFVFRRKRK
jgi:hypothetical protein